MSKDATVTSPANTKSKHALLTLLQKMAVWQRQSTSRTRLHGNWSYGVEVNGDSGVTIHFYSGDRESPAKTVTIARKLTEGDLKTVRTLLTQHKEPVKKAAQRVYGLIDRLTAELLNSPAKELVQG